MLQQELHEQAVAHGGPTLEHRKRVRRKEEQKKKVRNKEWQKESTTTTLDLNVLCCLLLCQRN